MIIMDFAKAVNNVRDMMLVYKLDYYGSRGPTHKWITSWLSERSQLSESGVGLSSLRSSPGPILCPQRIGFRAGPVFSFPENIRSFVRLLADDCDLQDDMNSLAKWETDWQMNLMLPNVTK